MRVAGCASKMSTRGNSRSATTLELLGESCCGPSPPAISDRCLTRSRVAMRARPADATGAVGDPAGLAYGASPDSDAHLVRLRAVAMRAAHR